MCIQRGNGIAYGKMVKMCAQASPMTKAVGADWLGRCRTKHPGGDMFGHNVPRGSERRTRFDQERGTHILCKYSLGG